jgi:hypothetical protein
VRPEPRFAFVFGVDQAEGRDRFIVSCGEGVGKKFFNDVWAFDLATETWRRLNNTGTPPRPRYGLAGGINPFDSRYLLVSHGFADTRFDDTFRFDLANEVWQELTPRGTTPTARCLQGSLVASADRLVFFGGCGSGGFGPCPGGDTWVLTPGVNESFAANARWDEVGKCPRNRIWSAMAISPGTVRNTSVIRQAVLFGGTSGILGSNDAAEVGVLDLDTGSWRLVRAAVGSDGAPGQRKAPVLAYVNRAQREPTSADMVVLFGGSARNDLWALEADETLTSIEELDCPFVFDLRLFHGVLMFLAWGVLLPFGVTFARFAKSLPNAAWFKVHRVIMPLGLLLALGGFIAALLMVQTNKFKTGHAFIGVVVMVLGLLQPINAALRPHPPGPGERKTCKRLAFEIIHRYSGRFALVLAAVNMFIGLRYIQAVPALHALYAFWVALVCSCFVVLTFMGEPVQSPVATWLNIKLLGGRFRISPLPTAPPALEAAKLGSKSELNDSAPAK